MELPGFERNPITGRYFRVLPGHKLSFGGCNHPSTSACNQPKMKLTVRPSNIPNVFEYFKNREAGSKSFYEGASGSAEYLRLRTTQKVLLETDNLNELIGNGDVVGVEFVKGLKESIVGLFRCTPRPSSVPNMPRLLMSKYAVLEQQYSNIAKAQNNPSVLFRRVNYLADVCDGPDNTIATLNNTFKEGSIVFMDRDHDMRFMHPTLNNFLETNCYYCCTTKNPGVNFAIGSENFIRVVSSFLCEDTFFVLGRILSLAFDESHNTMISGLHNGKMFVHDLRSGKGSPRAEFDLFRASIVELAFVDDFNIVAAGDPNHLIRLDLRKNDIVTHYIGHRQNLKKQSLSIVNNILCANGSDNTVRLWHVSGGTPIDEIRSDIPIRGWLNCENNKTLLYVFEGFKRQIYHIM